MSYDPCPHGHEPSVCEQCPRADGRVALDRATAQRLAASAKTARERALLAVNNQCLLGYEPPSAEEVLDAIEAAGLVVVDVESLDWILDRCEPRWHARPADDEHPGDPAGACCMVCDASVEGDDDMPIPH